MKKIYSDSERKQILADYIQKGLGQKSFDQVGKCVSAVSYFLTHASDISRRGYREFRRANASYLTINPWAIDAICGFLNFRGVGYSKKQNRKEETLEEKTSIISDKNKETLNGYLFWLQGEKDYSASTLRTYYEGIKRFYEYCEEFSQDNCRRFVATLEQRGFKPNTVRLRITALEKLGEYLKKPIKLKRPEYQRTLHTENVPTEAEYKKLCDYLKEEKPDVYFLVRVMGSTGCRVSELVQFTYEMIQQGSCTIKGKGSKYRQFFFTKELQELAKGKTGHIAINKYGNVMNPRGIDFGIKAAAEKCGIDKKKAHCHAFRHFFAKMFLKKTKDVVQLADLLGHGSVDTTRIYLQKSFAEQKREVNRVVSW